MFDHFAIVPYGVEFAVSTFFPNSLIGLGVSIARWRSISNWIDFQVANCPDRLSGSRIRSFGNHSWQKPHFVRDDSITRNYVPIAFTSQGGKQ